MIVATALMCLAMNVYHEARSEPVMAQYAVAMVTMNRADHDQAQVCQQVFKPHQFSWANGKVHKVKGGWQVSQKMQPHEQYAWWKAQRIALMTLTGRMQDFTSGSTFYHTAKVHPAWRLAFEKTRQWGAHVFYRQRDTVIADSHGEKQ